MVSCNKMVVSVIGIVYIMMISGCSAIFEKDIGNKTVFINSPPDSIRTIVATQTFWWDYVEGADFYNLQIVSPRFDFVERIMLDTNVTGDKFQFSLIPGMYEWRVSAYNSAYSTPYTIHSLFIDSTLDLSLQQVILKNPAPNSAKNSARIQFHWDKIYSASSYFFEMRQDNWNGDIIAGPVETSADTISFALEEGTYAWGVKALNDISGSQFSTRMVILDLTPPAKPLLKSPSSGKSFNGLPIQLTWERTEESGSVVTDSIFIATDSTNFLNNIKETHKTTNTFYNIGFSDEGDYYWRIRSIDAAGNKSQFSIIRKFSIETE